MRWLLVGVLVACVLNLAGTLLILTLLVDQHYRDRALGRFRRPRPTPPGNGQ